jgi:hypothetical protein
MWRALSVERSGLQFSVVAGPRQRSLSWVWSPQDSWSYFIISIFQGQLPAFISPRNMVAQLYLQAFRTFLK